MKMLSVFRKTMHEMLREPLILSVVFAPFFVLMYYLFFPSGSTTFGVMVLNRDASAQQANGVVLNAGQDVIEAMRHVAYPNGNPLLVVTEASGRAVAETRLRNRDAAVFIVIPPDFSRTLRAGIEGQRGVTTSITNIGDLTNLSYSVAAVLAGTSLDGYIRAVMNTDSPVQVTEEALGASAAWSEFENYVPGLLVFAVMMLVFKSAMAVTREVEDGTLRRLQLTRMKAWEFLGGVSAGLILVGVLSVVLGFVTAQVLGFRSQGPLWVAILVGTVSALSIIGAGLVLACFARTVSQAFVIANFPLPKVPLFSLGDLIVGLYDVLPPTHAVVALNKVLTLGAGLGDITYELTALLVLSVLYFGLGVWLFQRRHLRAM